MDRFREYVTDLAKPACKAIKPRTPHYDRETEHQDFFSEHPLPFAGSVSAVSQEVMMEVNFYRAGFRAGTAE